MRNILTSILLVLIFNNTYNQSIPNSGFEQWQGNNPVSWNTPNAFTATYGVTTVTQETTAPYSGNYSVKMETKSLFGYNIPGFITLGQISVNVQNPNPVTILGGAPFSQRPQYFEGYYKYSPSTGDNCVFQAFLLKRNQQNNAVDTIAKALFTQSETISDWTLFKVEFQYSSQDYPDTIQINFSSSNPNTAIIGSKLYVDNVSVTGGSVVNTNYFIKENYLCYIENNELCFLFNKNFNAKVINLYDITGKKINSKAVNTSKIKILIEKNKLYIYEIITDKSKYTGKIIAM